MKKAIVILSAVCLIICLSLSAFAAEVYTEKTFEYTIADESVTIVGYFGNDAEVTVPSMIAGYPVNAIATGAFTRATVKTLYLPDTIMTIEPGAIRAGITVVYNANIAPPENTPESEETPNIPEETLNNTDPQPNTAGKNDTKNTANTENNDTPATTATPDDSSGSVVEEDVELEEPEVTAALTDKTEPSASETENEANEDTVKPTAVPHGEATETEPEGQKNDAAVWPFIVAGAVIVLAVCVIIWKKTLKK